MDEADAVCSAGLGWGSLLVLMLSKLAMNLNLNFVYPYAPFLADYLGLNLSEYGLVLVLQEVPGVVFALIAPLLDEKSTSAIRRRLLTAHVVTSVTTIGILALPSGCLLGAAGLRFLFGFAYATLVADTAALVADHVSENRRGLALSLVEFSWALGDVLQLGFGLLMQGSAVLGLAPVSPSWIFLAVGLVSIPFALAVFAVVPRLPDVERSMQACCSGYGEVLRARRSRFFLFWLFSVSFVYNLFHTAYGVWLKEEYGVGQAGIGIIFAFTAAAEVAANIVAGPLIERLGPRQPEVCAHFSWMISVIMTGFARLFPYSVAAFLVFWIYVSAEFSYLVSWVLAAELAPGNQLTMFAAYGATQATGRMIGAGTAHPVWERGGLSSLSLLSTAFMLIAGVSLVAAVRRPADDLQKGSSVTEKLLQGAMSS